MGLGARFQPGVLQHVYPATLVRAEQKATGLGLYHMLVRLAILPASPIEGFLWSRVKSATPFAFGAMMATLSALALAGLVWKDSQIFDPLQRLL